MGKRSELNRAKHWRTCESCGKRTYFTRRAAKDAIRRTKHFGRKGDTNPNMLFAPYPSCDGTGWHTGHTVGRMVDKGR